MEGPTTPAKSPAPVLIRRVRPVRRNLASQGIVHDLNTNVQSVLRPPVTPPPSVASNVLSHSRAVSIVRSASLFAPAVTDDPFCDLTGAECLFDEEDDVADVGEVFGLGALAVLMAEITCWERHPESKGGRLVARPAQCCSGRQWHVPLGARGRGTWDRVGGCGRGDSLVWQDECNQSSRSRAAGTFGAAAFIIIW